MKKILLFLVTATITCCCHSQKNNSDIYRGFVKYQTTSAPGTITVSSTGFGKKKAESMKDAYKQAFYTLLFRGIAGSQYELPMIADENGKKNNPVVKALLDDGFSSFVMESTLQSEDKKVKNKDGAKGIMTTNLITINCESLKKYLENNNVIRKFGI